MKEECELLSLDLWDTIIKRDCQPDEIKAMTSEYLYIHYNDKLINSGESVYSLTKSRIECEVWLGEKAKSQGLDDEYYIKDVLEIWISQKTNLEKEYATTVIDELYEIELDNELKHSYLEPNIVNTINQYSYKKLICISDFYAGTDFIDVLLKKNKFPYKFDYIFISCEWGYNKRSGRIFDLVKRNLNINFSQQVHIGDNKFSDFKIPSKKGIRCVHYLHIAETKEWNTYKKLDVSFYDLPRIKQNALSPFFYGFISWIAETCLENKIKKIYFFTREGEFFKKIYDVLRENHVYQEELPEADILEVSRMATFLPSIRKCTIDEMMRLWNQYSCQTMEAFFKSLALPCEETQKFLDRYNIDKTDRIEQPWTNEMIKKLFRDVEFINFVEQCANNQRKLLESYFEQKGIQGNQKLAVVDIGWRGTIQDNLCYIYNDIQWLGLYMGLIPFLNKQPHNAQKQGYLNNYAKGRGLLSIFSPYEMICNSPNGSVCGYEGKNGKIVPVRKKDTSEDDVYYNYTRRIQGQILDDLDLICKWAERKYVLSKQFDKLAYKGIQKFAFYPNKECVKAFFELNHNEEFGMGQYFNKNVSNKWWLFILAVFNSRKRNEMKEFLIETTWPQGYFARYHLYLVLWLYNWKIKGRF